MTSPVVAHYEALSTLTSQMREAAIQGEWDKLASIEQLSKRQVGLMTSLDKTEKLDEPSLQRKIQLIKKILADDAEIRTHTTAWMSQLQRIMSGGRQERRVMQAYGVVSS